jgi:hypothetical protein
MIPVKQCGAEINRKAISYWLLLALSGSKVPKAEATVLITSIASADAGMFSSMFCKGFGISRSKESFLIKLSNSS